MFLLFLKIIQFLHECIKYFFLQTTEIGGNNVRNVNYIFIPKSDWWERGNVIAVLRQRGMTRQNLTQRDHSEARAWRQRGTTRLLIFGVTYYRVTAWLQRGDSVAST